MVRSQNFSAVRPALLLVFLTQLSACQFDSRAEEEFARLQQPPDPTRGDEEERDEGELRRGRERWIERMHLAPEGVDWRLVERRNAEREMARRNALAGSRAFVPTRWTEVGSRNQAGRIHCVTRVAGGGATSPLYAGADLGGIWRGNPDGSSWTPLSDNLYGGAHWLAVVPGDTASEPNVIVASTDGGSLHVSRDDGGTWSIPTGLPPLSSCRGMSTLDDANDTILVYGQFNSGGQRPGVFASTDRGRTFSNRWTGGSNWRGWMWVPRTGPLASSRVYLLQQGRIFTSINGGTSFTAGTTIDATATQGILTGCEAGAPTLYAALFASNTWKLYRSDDAGASWTFTFTITDLWDGTLCASTLLPNLVMFGGTEAWRSTNSGASFTKINGWGEYYGNPAHRLHADVPGIFAWPDPNEPLGAETWYVGTDGGLYESVDQGLTVNNLSLAGLGVSQYYSTLTSSSNWNLIAAGSQDQGYQRGVFAPSTGPGPSTDLAQLISGDYGHLTSSDGTHTVVYSTYPGFVLIQDGQSSPVMRQANFPAGSSHDWLPMVVADPLNLNAFFFAGEKLYRYTRSGNSWTPSIHSTFNFLASGGTFLTAIGISRSTPNRMYAATDAGRLFWSSDHGVTWTQSASSGPAPHYFYGNAIAVNPVDPLEAVVGGSGYGGPGVRRTLDGGVTWSAITTGLPATLVYDLAYSETTNGDVFAATEAGAYQFQRATNSWVNLMQLGTPITLYWSVEIVENGTKARFGTYSRGIWDYAIPGSGPQASWLRYGENLGGANVLDLDTQTNPHLGSVCSLDVVGAPGLIRVGYIYTSTFGGSIPFQGGTLLVDPISGFHRLRLEPDGRGSAPFFVPNDPLLIGTSRYFQAVVADPAQPSGYALSNGLEATFGP